MASCYRCKQNTSPVVVLVKVWSEENKAVSSCYGCKNVIQYGPEYQKKSREMDKQIWREWYEKHLEDCKRCQEFPFDSP